MPTLNVEENIQKIIEAITQMRQEIFRLEGSLRVFQSFKEAGLTDVDIPLKESAPESAPESEPEEGEVMEVTE